MAKSGSISASAPFGNVTLAWSESSQNITNNTTTISYTLSIYRSSSISSSASKKYSIVINGSTVASGTNTIGGSGTKTLKTGSVTIPHGSDGSKTFSYSFSQEIAITWGSTKVGTLTASGSGVLDTIPRTSKVSLSASSIALGSTLTIHTNRASSAFTHTIKYSFNGASGTLYTRTATASPTWTLPASLADRIPNSTSGSGTITCETYSGTTLIGSTSASFTATVPNNSSYNPAIGGLTAVEANSAVTIGAFVQGVSKVKLTMTGVVARYSATIKTYSLKFDGWSGSASTGTTGTLKGSGTLTATATITDSRGRTASRTLSVTVLAYKVPSVTKLDVVRANSNGTDNFLGTYAKVTRSATVSSLTVGGTQRNTLKYKILTKTRTASTWTEKVALTTHSGLSLTGTNTIGTYAVTTSYDLRIEVSDLFNTTIAVGVISTGEVTMSWGRTGIGVGKVWEKGALDVGGDMYIDGDLYTGSTIIAPVNKYASTGGGLDMRNSDILGCNQIFMSDPATGDTEAIQWAKSTTPSGSVVSGDYDSFRVYNGIGYLNSKPVFSDSDVLWTGALYLQASQTITPSLALTSCPNGWILVWSRYVSGAASNDNWSFNIIPRGWQQARTGNGGIQMEIGIEEGSFSKYIYCSNTTITGHDRNNTAPHNTRVLRFVLAY